MLFSLRGHTDRANAVQWLNNETIVSIGSDQRIVIWAYDAGTDPKEAANWKYQRVYNTAHANAINYLKAYSPTSTEYYILTMCVGGTMKLWQGENVQSIEFKDELLFGKNLQEAMGLVTYGDKHLLLVIGGYDLNIHLYLVPRITS